MYFTRCNQRIVAWVTSLVVNFDLNVETTILMKCLSVTSEFIHKS